MSKISELANCIMGGQLQVWTERGTKSQQGVADMIQEAIDEAIAAQKNPAPAQFEYELRYCIHREGGTTSYENRSLGEDDMAKNPGGRWGYGIYRRPVMPPGQHRSLEHIADFEHEDEARLVVSLIDPSAAQKTVRVAVIVEGGIVQEVCADTSVPVEIFVVDYDVEGNDERTVNIPQQDGEFEPAHVRSHGAGMIAQSEFWLAIQNVDTGEN